jgi:hypothetical protein
MVLDTDRMITTFSAIFTIVIISATGVQNVMNDKFRKLLINHVFLKHSILIASIYSTKTHEILQFSDKGESSFSVNLFKSILIWAILLMLFKIDLNLIVVIISLVIGSKAIKELKLDTKLNKYLLRITTYTILIVYIYGVGKYFMNNKERSKNSIFNSILKTL